MAYTFNRLEPVIIDNKECMPEPTPAARRRLELVRVDAGGDRDELAEAIAGCFPKDYQHVLDSVKTFMTELDINILRAYLTGGERAVRQVMDMSEKLAERQLDKLVDGGER